MDKVSIIIPTYNRKLFVTTAVKSAVLQTYPEKEILVVDDHSSYDIAVVLQDFKEDIVLIRNKKNMGYAATYNIGIQASSGEYVTLLNDDDVFQRGADALQAVPGHDHCCRKARHVAGEGTVNDGIELRLVSCPLEGEEPLLPAHAVGQRAHVVARGQDADGRARDFLGLFIV